MKMRHYVIIQAVIFCLTVPHAVFAADGDPDMMAPEEPSFTNPAQAQHAANIAEESFSEQDQQRAENYAEQTADEVATETAQTRADLASTTYAEKTAEEAVVQKSEEYADGVIEKNSADYEQQALLNAEEIVEAKAVEYADSVCSSGCTAREYEAAKQEIWDRAENYGGLEQITETEFQKIVDEERQTAFDYAYARATNKNYSNFYDAEFKKAYDSVYDRYYNAAYNGAYDPAYEEALADAVARIAGARAEQVERMRFEEHKGWGLIARELNVAPKYIGLKGVKPLSIEARPLKKKQFRGSVSDEALYDPENPSLEAEIADVTRRSKNSGWSPSQAATGAKGKSKKWVGLNETSAAANRVIVETVEGKGNSSKGRSGSASGAGISSSTNTSSSGLSTASSPSDNGKSNNGKSGSVGSSSGKSNNGKSDRGNSGKSDRGNSGKSDRGNSGKSNNGGGNGKGNSKK